MFDFKLYRYRIYNLHGCNFGRILFYALILRDGSNRMDVRFSSKFELLIPKNRPKAVSNIKKKKKNVPVIPSGGRYVYHQTIVIKSLSENKIFMTNDTGV